MSDRSWLPALLPFDWNEYSASLERAYAIFARDFIDARTRPAFLGRMLGLKRHPEYDGKNATFWHFVTEGAIETEREPKSARIERIAWPRPIIESAGNRTRVCVWREPFKSETRILLALPDFDYLVVLADRGSYVLPWTAYPIEFDHHREKLRRRFASAK